MDAVLLNNILRGALAMSCAVAALFFLRFWKDTGDRLFAFFALAFVVIAVNRLSIAQPPVPGRGDHVYWIRFVAFALILAAILDKHRTPRRPK